MLKHKTWSNTRSDTLTRDPTRPDPSCSTYSEFCCLKLQLPKCQRWQHYHCACRV